MTNNGSNGGGGKSYYYRTLSAASSSSNTSQSTSPTTEPLPGGGTSSFLRRYASSGPGSGGGGSISTPPSPHILAGLDRRHRSPDPPPRYNRGQSPLLLRKNLLELSGQPPGSPLLHRRWVLASCPALNRVLISLSHSLSLSGTSRPRRRCRHRVAAPRACRARRSTSAPASTTRPSPRDASTGP